MKWHIILSYSSNQISNIVKLFYTFFSDKGQKVVILLLFFLFFINQLFERSFCIILVLDCSEIELKIRFFSSWQMINFLKIQFFNKFNWLDSWNFLIQVRMNLLVKLLFKFDIKVRFELFEDFYDLTIFILEVTKKSTFFLIFLFIFVRCRLEIS